MLINLHPPKNLRITLDPREYIGSTRPYTLVKKRQRFTATSTSLDL